MMIIEQEQFNKLVPTLKQYLIKKTEPKCNLASKSLEVFIPKTFTLNEALEKYVEIDVSELLQVTEEEYQQMLEQSQGVE